MSGWLAMLIYISALGKTVTILGKVAYGVKSGWIRVPCIVATELDAMPRASLKYSLRIAPRHPQDAHNHGPVWAYPWR